MHLQSTNKFSLTTSALSQVIVLICQLQSFVLVYTLWETYSHYKNEH